MRHLYITADVVGEQSGGGQVTIQEALALRELDSQTEVWDRRTLQMAAATATRPDPWCWDDAALWMLQTRNYALHNIHAHFYSGTFSKTVAFIKEKGGKVSYTVAAHSIEESRRAFKELGLPYDYPHLTDPEQWKQYSAGTRLADLIICPSQKSRDVMRQYGHDQPIEVIPHGVTLPRESDRKLPERFTVGYLGAIGPDKGLIYLIKAWAKLDYPDALLILAGKYSDSGFVHSMLQANPGGKVSLWGWVENVSTFYDAISLYCQPSVTEGFGIEVAEAFSYSKPVVCSEGAGASDLVAPGYGLVVPARDVDALAAAIRFYSDKRELLSEHGASSRKWVENCTWVKVRSRYKEVWRQLVSPGK